jgi:hypothetical protein
MKTGLLRRSLPDNTPERVTGEALLHHIQCPGKRVFFALNTFFALVTQEDQVRCFANVARHLAAGGRFAIEAFVPDATRWDRGQRTSTLALELDRVDLEVGRHDPVAQTIDGKRRLQRDDARHRRRPNRPLHPSPGTGIPRERARRLVSRRFTGAIRYSTPGRNTTIGRFAFAIR